MPATSDMLAAAGKGVQFLKTTQLPSGQFPMEVAMRTNSSDNPWSLDRTPELSPFCTAYIAESLARCDEKSDGELITRALTFLENEKGRGDLWRYWCKNAPLHSQIPPDVDDTACISHALKHLAGAAPNNRDLLLANKNADGLFYTWMIPRMAPVTSLRWWSLVLTDQTYGRAVTFWRSGASRGDIDSVVNANAVLYLGAIPETERATRWLRAIAEAGGEERTDRWYRSRPAFYFATSRCYSNGQGGFAELANFMRRSFLDITQADGSIGGDVLQTALALGAIRNFGVPLDGHVASLRFILEKQRLDGGWDWCPIYYDGRPHPVMAWGSRSVTTGFCIEALRGFARLT